MTTPCPIHLCHHCEREIDCATHPECCERGLCVSCIDHLEGETVHAYEDYGDYGEERTDA